MFSTSDLASTQDASDERVAVPALEPVRFAYAGVSFEILSDFGPFEMGGDHLLFAQPEPGIAPIHVLCAVTADPSLEDGGESRDVRWQWDGGRGSVRISRATAEIRRFVPGSYAVSARVVPDANGCAALVTALAGAAINREGGLVLHASAIELDGRAVLFIGPSGAGKTTAANHTPGARWLARDRAAVVPGGGGYLAFPMAGGDEIDLPRSDRAGVPVAAILRVRRGRDAIAIEELSALAAVRDVRESVQSGSATAEEEERRLDAIVALASRVPVASIYTKLHTPLTEPLSEWLGGLA